jgi:hypothetical protein
MFLPMPLAAPVMMADLSRSLMLSPFMLRVRIKQLIIQ